MFKCLRNGVFSALFSGLLLAANGANAYPIVFNFANPGADVAYITSGGTMVVGGDIVGDDINLLKGGIGLNISAVGTDRAYWDLSPGSRGLGVVSPISLFVPTVFENGSEVLQLQFSQTVRVTEMTFRDTNGNTLDLDGVFAVKFDTSSPSYYLLDPVITLFPGTLAQTLQFSGGKIISTNSDDFYLASISIDTDCCLECSEVPEPSTYLLLGSSLGLVGLSRARRKAFKKA